MRRREVACLVAGILLLGLSVSWAVWSRRPRPMPTVEAPACEGRVLVRGRVARPGAACVERGEELSAVLAAAGATCGVAGETRTVRPGARVEVGPRDGVSAACGVRVERLPGAAQLTLGSRLDVNGASAADLEAVPGIGPVLAGAIVEERSRGGPFSSLADLERVPGIGPVRREAVARFLVAGR